MLSFIRKRFPSKDRNSEHVQHEHQNNQMRKSRSAYELHASSKMKVKNREKEGTLSPTSNQINQSYSEIDYFPMTSNNHDQTTKDTLTDFYLNPTENIQIRNPINYVTIPTRKIGEHSTSVSDPLNKQQVSNYKGVDHQRTKALRETIQQRTQQKLFH